MGRTFENRKHAMAKTAAHKTKVYSKYGREIYVCAKNGSPDPDANLSLRRLIEKAKKDQVPSHVIDKALDKAKGAGGEDYHHARYEGFGPGNCMVIVDCLTDNNTRTFAEVRQCFIKNAGKIGAPGAVAHMFDHKAILAFTGPTEEEVLEALMEADVDVTDLQEEEGMIIVSAPPTEFYKAKTALTEQWSDLQFEIEEVTFEAQVQAEVTGDDVAMFERFMAALDNCDDVQEVYHNAVVQ